MEVAAAQIHNSDYRLEAEQAHHIAVAVGDCKAVVVVVDVELAVVVEDRGIPHHFVCTIPVWNWDSYTSE